jgi:hypothetical protein
MSTGMKLLGAFTLGSIALLFAGAFAADTYHERRLREQEQRYRR